MHKVKFKRFNNLSIDTAAMCDIAFLMLVFFIATSKFKSWEPTNIKLPAYSNRISDPDFEPTTILVSQGKVMLEIPDQRIRTYALSKMAEKYHLTFTTVELAKFNSIDIIGTPLSGLKQYIDSYYQSAAFFSQTGIPCNTLANNELSDWILFSKENIRSQLIIKADKNVLYPQIQQVISILQHQHINKFSLLTTSKTSSI